MKAHMLSRDVRYHILPNICPLDLHIFSLCSITSLIELQIHVGEIGHSKFHEIITKIKRVG